MNKRVLIIAPYFAPYTEVSAIRIISLSRDLIRANYDVDVYCYSSRTLVTLTEEKNLKARIPEGVQVINFDLTKSKVPLFGELIDGYSFLSNLKKDVNIETYQAVLISVGPFFTLQSVKYIKKKGIPCLLDFRDLGAIAIRPKRENVSNAKNPITKLIKRVYRYAYYCRERSAVNITDSIIVVSKTDWDMMQNEYSIPNEKMVLASNGYDDSILDGIFPRKNSKTKIVLGVFGKFMYYSIDRAVGLLKAVNKLRHEGIDIVVMHIGQEYPWIKDELVKNDISLDCYLPEGLMAYRDGMELLGTSDFFIVEDTSPDDVGTKIYDYIFFNKPVIASVPENIPLARLVGSFEHGYVCSNDASVEQTMRNLVREMPVHLDSNLDPTYYSRSRQNRIIIDKINEYLR